METQVIPQMKDELGEKVQKLFQDFLEEYVLDLLIYLIYILKLFFKL